MPTWIVRLRDYPSRIYLTPVIVSANLDVGTIIITLLYHQICWWSALLRRKFILCNCREHQIINHSTFVAKSFFDRALVVELCQRTVIFTITGTKLNMSPIITWQRARTPPSPPPPPITPQIWPWLKPEIAWQIDQNDPLSRQSTSHVDM